MSATTDRLTKLRNLASHPATPPAEAAAARGKIADIEALNPDLKESANGKQRSAFAFMSEEYIREHLERMARESGSKASRGPNPFYPDSGWDPWEYSEQQERKRREPPNRANYATREAYERVMKAWLREHTNAYAKQRQDPNQKPRSQPRREDYENLFEFNEAMLAWLEANRGTTSRPDPDDVHFEADAQWKSYQARNKSEAASSRPDPFWGWTNPPDGQGDSGGYNHRPNASEQAYQQGVKAISIAKVTYSKVSQELHECGLDVSPSEWEVLIRQLLQSR